MGGGGSIPLFDQDGVDRVFWVEKTGKVDTPSLAMVINSDAQIDVFFDPLPNDVP